ncbi:hypothetical protein CMK14_03525 [Candidatus Poribacteria bacterium]|nr:hypothetical protein [Candidatus Poribacteria bacterium]
MCQVAACPVTGIGGVTAERGPDIMQCGARGFAVISAICTAIGPMEAIHQLMAAIKR